MEHPVFHHLIPALGTTEKRLTLSSLHSLFRYIHTDEFPLSPLFSSLNSPSSVIPSKSWTARPGGELVTSQAHHSIGLPYKQTCAHHTSNAPSHSALLSPRPSTLLLLRQDEAPAYAEGQHTPAWNPKRPSLQWLLPHTAELEGTQKAKCWWGLTYQGW